MTPRILVVGLLVVAVAALGYQSPASPSQSTPTPAGAPETMRVPRSEHRSSGGLDRALSVALSQAAADAAYDGVSLSVTSGRRSPEHQERLLQEAVVTYGSEAEAARWVATPETSPHVSGDAVDIGPTEAAAWLSEHGSAYGLCQIYDNEPWHYELRPEAISGSCPATYPDPTYDPRMQR